MNIVYCCDRRMLPALHVAVLSMLTALGASADPVSIFLFSADLDESDASLLRKTIAEAERDCSLQLHLIDGTRFAGFPALQASFATYFRLVVPEILAIERLLYIDVDTLCRTDITALYHLELDGHPIGLVPEAPIHKSADPEVARLLGSRAQGYYYNAGVMLVDAAAWRRGDLTERCLDFIQQHPPRFYDQTALNYILHGDIQSLPARFNSRTNARENWAFLLPPISGEGNILHFVDFPKPWSAWGEFIHPLGKLWAAESRRTASFMTTANTDRHSFRVLLENRQKYLKILKDKILFSLLSARLISRVKGMNSP